MKIDKNIKISEQSNLKKTHTTLMALEMGQSNQSLMSFLEVAIDLVEDKYKKVFTDYQELAEKICLNFKVDVTKEQILEYYEEYYCQIEKQDKKVQVKNLGINY